jgi:phosphocarrier protein HPr
MVSNTFKVLNPSGFHMRPAKEFAQKAAAFPCDVTLIKDGKRVNGKNLLVVLTLGIDHMDEVTLETNGEQEEAALAELGELLQKIYQE